MPSVEVVILDGAIPDQDQILEGLLFHRCVGTEYQVAVLDPLRDGVSQTSRILAGLNRPVSALHFITHGAEHGVQLGTTWLDPRELRTRAPEISAWAEALAPGADLLLYGCKVAQSDSGRRFARDWSLLTGADVAASIDPTGSSRGGGNWILEYRTGPITAAVAVGPEAQRDWDGLLDITTGLLGHWRFDTNANDFSGNSYDGTLTNGAQIDNATATNKVGHGKLSLDGNNDYVELSAHRANFASLTQGTISAWIKTGGPAIDMVFELSDIADSDSYAAFYLYSDGTLSFTVIENNTYQLDVWSNAAVDNNTWRHVAVTVGTSGNKLYVDGAQAAVTYGTGNASRQRFFNNITGIDFMAIGIDRNNGGFHSPFPGLIDDVRVYNRPLSATDIAELSSLYTLSGRVFEDADFAGTAANWDGGGSDLGLDNVDVELYDGTDSYVTSVTTASGGSFSFLGLNNGSYKVRGRSATVGDANTPPKGTLNGTVPGTWPYPLPEMTWAYGAALYGGQNAAADDTDTGDNSSPGDTHVGVPVSGANVTGVNLGFAYNLIVNTVDDGLADNTRSHQGSLRQFLKNANAVGAVGGTTANASEFRMQVATNQSDAADAWWRITAAAALVSISDPGTVVDGSTQRINAGTDSNARGPEIELFGNAAVSNGLRVAGVSSVRIQELVVNGFTSSGVLITGAGGSSNEIYGCYVGTDATGESAVANSGAGILLDSSTSNNDLGGINAGEGNLISGNGSHGIQVLSSGSNRIRGNTIGTDRAVASKIPNGSNGIYLNGTASGNTIGGPATGEGNVVSGNSNAGIWADFGQTNVTIQGNTVGTGLTKAETTLGNSFTGIRVSVSTAAADVLVGGEGPEDGNFVAENGQQGLYTVNAGTGVRFVGNTVRSNGFGGIYSRTDGTLVAKNLVSGNGAGYPGIRIANEFGTGADGNEIYQNTVHGNGTDGILVEGTGTVLRNNILAGNGAFGIDLSGGSMTESHNNVTDDTTSPANASGRSNVALDPTDLNVDPLFVDAAGGDFTLTECTSPSINVGLDLGGSQPDMNGGNAGLFTGIAPDQGAFESTCLGLTLTITKKAFLSDGTPVPHGAVVPRGTPIQYLLYINNTGPARTDVSLHDVLDPSFEYQSTTIRSDGTVPACITGTCSSAEELTIFTAVKAQTAGTDAVDGDTVSYNVGSRTVDVGDAIQSNGQLDIPANSVYAVIFEVKMR